MHSKILVESEMLRRPSPSLVISMLALLIALGGVGYSANGGNLIIGIVNSASSRTTLTSQYNGQTLHLSNPSTAPLATALILAVAADHPPFKVSNSVKIAKLNVDLLDGLDSTAFAQSISEGWHYVGDPGKPPFQNGWGNFNGPGQPHNQVTNQHAAFRVDSLGVIHLGGLVAGGTIGQTIFTLPTSYCPLFTKVFPAISNNAFARVTVNRYGSGCNVFANIGSTDWLSLEGVSFLTYGREARISN